MIDTNHTMLHKYYLPPQVGAYREFYKNDNEKISPSLTGVSVGYEI